MDSHDAKAGAGGADKKILSGEGVGASDTADTAAGAGIFTRAKSAAGATVDRAKDALKRRRGRPSNAERAAAAEQSQVIEQQAGELEKIFTPENWESIVRAPADMALAVTGRPIWDLPEKEVKTLAVSASQTARYWLAIDPKYLVLFMFVFQVSITYGGRIATDAQNQRKAREKEKADAAKKAPEEKGFLTK